VGSSFLNASNTISKLTPVQAAAALAIADVLGRGNHAVNALLLEKAA
jgi:hypothetical protein